MPLFCQIYCAVPPRLYVLETALLFHSPQNSRGFVGFGDHFLLWFYILKVLLQLSKDAAKHRINIELSFYPQGLHGGK